MTYRRKLIEVALPLEAINKESAREKSIRHGHPSTLHLWWARRPLAACRAVLFASLVDDPSEYMPDEESANAERERLFDLIEELVLWENVNNEEVLDKARLEIARSVARDLGVDVPVGKQAIREFLATKAPPVLDPFAGGGSIPLEAQRLGLRAYASDLNPVAVLINKALIEIPPKFAGMPPVHPPEEPKAEKKGKKANQAELWKKEWKGAEGLAEDVRYYGQWMRDEAYKRIGHLYPPVKITAEVLSERLDLKAQGLKPGDELTVIAWLWARTIKCPNPVCGAQMPLVRSFVLSTKKSRQAWIEPFIDHNTQPHTVSFVVKTGQATPLASPKVGRGAQFRCLACGQVAAEEHLKSQGRLGQMGVKLMAIVCEGRGTRLYFPPITEHENIEQNTELSWKPELPLSEDRRAIWCPLYGLDTFDKLFTYRQLMALTTYTSLIEEVFSKIENDVGAQGEIDSDLETYAIAITTYLGFGISKLSDALTTLARWKPSMNQVISTFARQGIPMVWDYAESNLFNSAAGDFLTTINTISRTLSQLPTRVSGSARQSNAIEPITYVGSPIISTDPPYYDNITYSDLSDFFYVWLRRSLSFIYPELFNTILVPKANELVAASYRFGGDKGKAKNYFEEQLEKVFCNVREAAGVNCPVTIFYAFKQSETAEESEINDDKSLDNHNDLRISSTGWETMLQALITAGFRINGTWPMRTELGNRTVASGTNALASSIVLVCRPRPTDVVSITRRDFLSALKREIPPALRQLQRGNIAPVDLAQAAIGPGMAVFSRYKHVLEADGSPMRVRTALALINQTLDEFLAEQEGEYDGDTRWAVAWFEQYGHEQGPYGMAETLSKAKNTSVNGLVEAGFLEARAGKVRLLRRDELDPEWNPQKDKRPTAWEASQHLIYDLEKGGEQAAAGLLSRLGSLSETARDLAYRLYTVCERKGWAQDALGYNMLVVAWPRLKDQAGKLARQERLL